MALRQPSIVDKCHPKTKQIWAQSTFIHSGTRVPIPGPDQSNPSVAIKMKEVILDKTASLVLSFREAHDYPAISPPHHES
ncbi:Uncharacterized protein HZ326_2070 [Fusarium oxysporum f. sp. albedinis]|nr:Uncharacterized protein HZ326_2070 [Fusarium oxysporum f. sp. albedinis]